LNLDGEFNVAGLAGISESVFDIFVGNKVFEIVHPLDFFSHGVGADVPNNFGFGDESEAESFLEITNIFESSFENFRLESIDLYIFDPFNLDTFVGFSN